MDTMSSTPSDDIKILDRKTREDWGLGYENVAFKEFEKAMTIQICGNDFYDMKTRYFGTLESCRSKLGISILDERHKESEELAGVAFPNFFDEFSKCKKLKSGN